MAYQKRNKGPRYKTTGSIKPGPMNLQTAIDCYKRYLAAHMRALQNKARQAVHRSQPYYGRCKLCGNTDTSKFYVDYGTPPQVIDLCQSCHKEASQHRGTIYDQLIRHGVPVLSWEEWRNANCK